MQPVNNSDGTFNYTASLFHEEPNKYFAYLAGGNFALLFIIHLIQAARLKTKYMAALIVGVLLEGAGYGVRILAINSPFDTKLFAMQQSLIVISPVLIAASQYIIMEKIICFVDTAASPVRPSLIAKIFVTTDVISFIVQGVGSGMLVASISTYSLGNNILIGGLVLQVLCYIAFISIGAVYFARTRTVPTDDGGTWRRAYKALLASCVFVLVRSVFRVIEFAAGCNGPIASNEKFMYAFDFALILNAVGILLVFHPGMYLKFPAPKSYRLVLA
ncbi:hypothetical protein HDU84_000199 [Entophlyctis sp. JEL0112]|nr:hypothetical protein HDU84_000199 [Entophlyctis sp. JEL0112]